VPKIKKIIFLQKKINKNKKIIFLLIWINSMLKLMLNIWKKLNKNFHKIMINIKYNKNY